MPVPADVQPGDVITADFFNQILAALQGAPTSGGATLPGGVVHLALQSSPSTMLHLTTPPNSLEYALWNQMATSATLTVSTVLTLTRSQAPGASERLVIGPTAVYPSATSTQALTSVTLPAGERRPLFVRPVIPQAYAAGYTSPPATLSAELTVTATRPGSDPIVETWSFTVVI